MSPKRLQKRRCRSSSQQEVVHLQERRTAPSRGLRLLCGAFGDDLLEVLAAQQVLRDALALLKLGQDDGDVSVGGGLPEGGRKTNALRTFTAGFCSLNYHHHMTHTFATIRTKR